MKLKKYIAALLVLVTLLLAGCDDMINDFLEGKFPSDLDDGLLDDLEDQSNDSSDSKYDIRGRIYSEESDQLVLIAAWHATAIDSKTVKVSVRVGIKCYGISTERHDLVITVNGEEQTIQTPPIESKGSDQPILLAQTEFTVKLSRAYRGELEISAVWNYNGTYNGVSIDSLTAAACISFPDGEIITEETTTETTDDKKPSDSKEPSDDPDAPLYRESGRIFSTESNMLVLFAEWTAISTDGETVTITVTPGIECYRMRTGGHPLTIRVNDKTAKYTTAPIEHGSNEKISLLFIAKEFEIDLTEEPLTLNISVEWDYNDTDGYNPGEIDNLSAETSITLPGIAELAPEVEAQELSPSLEEPAKP